MDKKDVSFAKPVPEKKFISKVQVKAEKKTKPVKPETKTMDRKELDDWVVAQHNDGVSQSKIGLILKKEYNINSFKKLTGKTILEHLTENKVAPEIPEDLTALLKKAVLLIKHQKINKKDMTAKRGYQLTVSKIRCLSKYYKKKAILPKTWLYSEKKAALLVR